MCSISASYYKSVLGDLVKQNLYRGSLTHSYTSFDIRDDFSSMNTINRNNFPLDDIEKIRFVSGELNIVHTQAPTSKSDRIQPAYAYDSSQHMPSYLWHNGIILNEEISRLNKILGTDFDFDTDLLLYILDNNINLLSDIAGSFSCIYYREGALCVLRNEIAPLYYNKYGDMSSTEFKGSISLPPNKIFVVSMKDTKFTLTEVKSFKTKANPYYIED